jgi:4-hydroxybenzoate polyprenyltransferase
MSEAIALCVDLDGSLIRTDLLQESALILVRTSPLRALCIPAWILQGRAVVKERIAQRVDLRVDALPYNEDLLQWLVEERAAGRRLVLCTAADAKYAQQVADHLGIFDEVISSDGQTNNSAKHKAAVLARRFGLRGYDYVGNSGADRPVWAGARRSIAVGASAARIASGVSEVQRVFESRAISSGRAWVRQLRLHQWVKNLLLFLPLLGAHRYGDLSAWVEGMMAFVAFGLCASGVYVVNDLMDLESDRSHVTKRLRPLASGAIGIPTAIVVAILLLAGSFGFAVDVSTTFAGWLAVYLAVTTLYSFGVKRIALIDCMVLAGLYTLRVVAGGAAIDQPVSFWLLGFSLFLFLSLAFVKRYAEVMEAAGDGAQALPGRGYLAQDLPVLLAFGAASGFASALVLALYLNSEQVLTLYSHPDRLWFALPVLLYWISWIWLSASRGRMHQDPVVYAVREPASLVAGALFLAVIWMAR